MIIDRFLENVQMRRWARKLRLWYQLNEELWDDDEERSTHLFTMAMSYAERGAFANGVSIDTATVLSPQSPSNPEEYYLIYVGREEDEE